MGRLVFIKEGSRRTKQYWRMVANRARREAWEATEMRGILLFLLALFIVSAGILIRDILVDFPLSIDDLLNDLRGDRNVQLVYTGVFLTMFVIAFFFKLVFVPPKIHEEQENSIEQYKEQIARLETSATVKVNVELFPRPKDGYVSIKIHNEENEDILKPELKYSEIDLIRGESSKQMLNEINSGNAAISRWLGGQTAVIGGRDHIVFNLAKLEKHKCLFLFNDGTKSPINQGLYKFSVFLDGRIGTNEKKIERIEFKNYYLEYWTEILERLEPRGDTHLRILEKATFLDIRESVERIEKIDPSFVSPLSMNEAIRHTVKNIRGTKND